MAALYRNPAGPGAVILTSTDGTDPDGYIELVANLFILAAPWFFLELLIVIA